MISRLIFKILLHVSEEILTWFETMSYTFFEFSSCMSLPSQFCRQPPTQNKLLLLYHKIIPFEGSVRKLTLFWIIYF